MIKIKGLRSKVVQTFDNTIVVGEVKLMKKIVIIVLLILSFFTYSSASSANEDEILKTIEKFSKLIRDNTLNEVNSILTDQKVIDQFEEFIKKNKIIDY